ncbi:hypothetical protein ACTXT7_006079 [Hymenolepis weldensis]
MQQRVTCCVSLRSCELQAPFLDRTITNSDEKWILYSNVQRKRQSWLSRGSKPISQPKKFSCVYGVLGCESGTALGITMSSSEGTCEKWQDVSFTTDNESINGTLFLLSPNSEDTAIQWIPISGNISDKHIPPKIPLSTITQVERRRFGFDRRYTGIFFRISQSEVYGPFEFIKGGSADFIDKLRSFIELQRQWSLSVGRFSATPMSVFQGVGTRFLNVFGGPRVKSDAALNGAAGSNFYLDRSSPGTFDFLNPDLVSPTSTALMAEQILSDRSLTSGEAFTTSSAPGDDEEYQIISRAPPTLIIPDLRPVPRKRPVTMEVWRRYLDREGRVTVVEKLQNAIYNGGIDPELRPIAWKYLFGYLKWDYTEAENAARVEEKQ